MSWYDNVFLGAPEDEDEDEGRNWINQDDEPDDLMEEFDDGDCDYWSSNCYGRG